MNLDLRAWVVLGLMVFVFGQTNCEPPSPPAQFPDYPLALDCVIGSDQLFVPIDISVDPDRFAEALKGMYVEIEILAHLPQDVFCAFVDAGYVSGTPMPSTVTTHIGASLYPVPPLSVGTAAPIAVTDFVAACAGDFGPEVTINFDTPRQTVQPDGSGPMDFWLDADSIDIGFLDVQRFDTSVVPQLSLLELCIPTDKSEPPNGATDDPDDSPRIAADKDGDGAIYEAYATIDDQIQIAVSGTNPCLGCDDGNDCTNDICDPSDGVCTHVQSEDFTSCDFGGTPGACIAGTCAATQTKTIPVSCANSVSPAQQPLPFELTVATTPVAGGQAPQDFTAAFTGFAVFPEFFLDAAQPTVSGGVQQAELVDLVATVQVRSGATGPDVPLAADTSSISPGPTRLCNFPTNQVCVADSECLGQTCNPPVVLIEFPTSADCTPGGLCEQLGKSSQCAYNNFCITGDLLIPLGPASATFTPDSSGAVLFGWADQNVPGLTLCPAAAPACTESFHLDGSYDLPPASFSAPTGPVGVRLNINNALFVPLQCAMAEPGGVCAGQPDVGCLTHGECGASGPCDRSVSDIAMPSPDASLIYIGVDEPDVISCGAADCNDGNPCSIDSCGAGDMCVHTLVTSGSPCVSNGLPGACLSGACLPVCSLLDCDDGEPCTTDSCNDFSGTCDNSMLPDLTTCDLGGTAGACSGGSCQPACDVLDCDDGDDCTTDSCDPGAGTCSNVTAPNGTACDFGGLPGVCSAGTCLDAALCAGVSCDDANACTDDSCDPSDGSCVHTPVVATTACDYLGLPGLCSLDACASACDVLDCDDDDECTEDLCDPFVGVCSSAPTAEGATCDAGFGQCQSGVCQPTAPVWSSQTKAIPLSCGALAVPFVSIAYDLTVRATPIVGGQDPRDFTAEFSGRLLYPEEALDALQLSVAGGAQAVSITNVGPVVIVREGAQGSEVQLGLDESSTPNTPKRFCNFPQGQVCTVDSECLGGTCNPPVPVVDVPTSSDCAPGGVCDGLGKTGTGSQCDLNGFCVTGDLSIWVGVETATYTPEASGTVIFDWKTTPKPRVFFVGQASDVVHIVGCDSTSPPDAALVYFPIDDSQPVWCDGVDCNDGSGCTTDSCALPSGACLNDNFENGTLCDFDGLPGTCVSGACIAVCDTTDCDDLNECTTESCNPYTGLCDTTVLDGSSCDANGDAGICVGSTCTSVCAAVGCDDGDECTLDNCDPASGACTNPVAPNGTSCDFGGLPGICISGICEDAMLCDGIDCDDGNVCTDDYCDPLDGSCQHDPVPSSVSCNSGGGPGVCIDGACKSECALVDCDDGVECTEDVCNPIDASCSNVLAPDGSFCDSGYGRCQSGSCDPIPPGEWAEQSQVVTVACTNSITPAQEVLPYELTVRTTPITGGTSPEPFVAEFTGVAIFPEFFIDATQIVVPGGVQTGELLEVVATVQIRSGAAGPDVELGPDAAAVTPGLTRLCNYPPTQACSVDSECIGGICNPPTLLIDFPTSTDCAPGGVCEQLGKTAQCTANNFCIVGDAIVPLASETAIYTPDASGEVLFGWADQGVPGLVTCPAATPNCQESFMPDGCYDLPAALFDAPASPLGVRMNETGLFVPLQCAGATAGGICASGEGCIVDADCASPPCNNTADVVCPTQDAGLISFPIN